MGRFPSRNSRAYPLHVAISAVFTTLLVWFGVALILFNFYRARSEAFVEADRQLHRIADHLSTSVAELYGPSQNVVDLASRMRLSTKDTNEVRRREMRTLAESLRLRREISSIFVGNDDGSFSLVRSLRDRQKSRTALKAPPGAEFALQTILRSGDHGPSETLDFFDSNGSLIGHRIIPWGGFDPRERDWYQAAINPQDQIASGAYVFFTTREIGVTIARRLTDQDGVVGVDLALSDLSAGLGANSVTPSSRQVLLSRSGHVFASSDPGFVPRLANGAGKSPVSLPRLSDLNDPG